MDAILKGLVLAEAWGLKKMTFITDSQTVYGWLGALLNNTKRVKVSGLHEVGVKHRLQVIRDRIDAMGVQVDVSVVYRLHVLLATFDVPEFPFYTFMRTCACYVHAYDFSPFGTSLNDSVRRVVLACAGR